MTHWFNRALRHAGPHAHHRSSEGAGTASTGDTTDPRAALSELEAGEVGTVDSLCGGHDFCSRVANLGFTVGALIEVVQNYRGGPMLVSLRGTLVALGRREAARIMVRPTVRAAQGQE